MEGLLKWSIAAQKGDTSQKPDPKALAELFGAPDEVTQMRAELTVASDSSDKDDRIEYLEKFEEHVENVDNANNIGEMWGPLVKLTTDSDDDVKALALSCVAAAVQNNQKSQADFLNVEGGFANVVSSVSSPNDLVSTKALFALSSEISHFQPAYTAFENLKGWDLLDQLLKTNFETSSGSPKKQARVLSLLYAITLNLPYNTIYDHLEDLKVEKRLENIKEDSLVVQEKVTDILRTLKENPRSPVKLLA